MSTLTVAEATAPARAPERTVPATSTFAGIMRGEWIKLLSLRSTWWTLGLTVTVIDSDGLSPWQ